MYRGLLLSELWKCDATVDWLCFSEPESWAGMHCVIASFGWDKLILDAKLQFFKFIMLVYFRCGYLCPTKYIIHPKHSTAKGGTQLQYNARNQVKKKDPSNRTRKHQFQ